MTNILFLDLGIKTGYCLTNQYYKILSSGVIDVTKPVDPKDKTKQPEDSMGLRLHNFRYTLLNFIRDHDVRSIYYELVDRHYGQYAGRMYYSLYSHVEQLGFAYHIKVVGIPVATIKKTITGKGNANKTTVMKAVYEKTQVKPKDDNHADAVALMWHLKTIYNTRRGE